MKNRTNVTRELIRKLALITGSATLLMFTGAPVSQANTASVDQAVTSVGTAASPAPSPSPSPSSSPKRKNKTVTNPGPAGPTAPRAGVKPPSPPSRLRSALTAAGLAAPASSLSPSPSCVLSATTATCDLWALAGTISFPASPAPLVVPVWGFSTSSTGPAQVPGPILIANAGESISITVHNQLPASPPGLDIPNQISIEVPASQARTDLSGIEIGNLRTYNFGALAPGTYLYEAGPTPFGARQVKMGLAGILIVRPSNFATCNCAYGNGVSDAFVDESPMLLNEFDPAFNSDPFNFDPADFRPSEYTINGLAFDPTNSTAGKINVVNGDVLLLHYANLSDHERGITIANQRQVILADDSYQLANPLDVATKWLNPGQVSDSFVTVDPASPPNTHIPVYDAGLHLSNGADLGLGGMFTYLDVIQGLAGTVTGPVTTVTLGAPTNSGIEPVNVSGNITASAGATLTDAEWFLDNPGTPGTAPTCPITGFTLGNGGSGFTAPVVTLSGGGGTGATATASGKIDAINLGAHGGGYTRPSVTVAGSGGGAATASGQLDGVKVTQNGAHYAAPTVGFTGGGGSGAAGKTSGPVDSLTFGTPGAGYTSPSVVFTGGGATTSASAAVTGIVDNAKLITGDGYSKPVVTLTGGGGGTGASFSITGGVDSLAVGSSAGSGYTAPTVAINNVDGNGGGATASAQFNTTTGAITGLTILTPGSGYTQAPAVVISDPTGTGATTATSTINLSAITFVAGSGYGSAPQITITDSTGTGALATATISVTAISLSDGGSGYSAAPGITIIDSATPATATTLATATATVAVTAVVLSSFGSGYTSAPAVAITDTGAGSGALAAATITITAITPTNYGNGYTVAPGITIADVAGGAGHDATAVATLTITAITLTNPGYGYRTAPTVNINDSLSGTGSGASATATVTTATCLYQHFAVSGTSVNYNFTITSADLNNLLLTGLNRDGDHVIWVHGQDSSGTGTWGVVSGDVFSFNATGPIVGALTVHASPTNGNRPTDVINGAGTPDPITLVPGNLPNQDLVVLGTAAASLSNFVVTAAEYCIDTHPCTAVPHTANPNGPISILLTPSGSDGTQPIDAYGALLPTSPACTPVPSPPGVSTPGLPAAPGGGSIASFCADVPQSILLGLSEGLHTLYIHACEQLAGSAGGCATQPTPRWAAYNADSSATFIIDKTGPASSNLAIDPNPNNGHQISSGDLNFVDSLQFAATLSDPVVNGVNSNIAYGEVFVTAPGADPSCPGVTQAGCQSSIGPIDPVTHSVMPDGSGAEMFPSGATWDTSTKIAYAYIPLAELTQFSEGYVRFWVHAQDQAGNFGGWAYTDLTYDKTPPVIDSVTPAAPATIFCRSVAGCTISFTAHDPLSGGVQSNIVQAEWFNDQGAGTNPGYGNGTPITLGLPLSPTASASFNPGRQARANITIRVRDAAGNWSLNSVVVTK